MWRKFSTSDIDIKISLLEPEKGSMYTDIVVSSKDKIIMELKGNVPPEDFIRQDGKEGMEEYKKAVFEFLKIISNNLHWLQ